MAAPLPSGLAGMIPGLLSPDLISKASSLIAESPDTTRKGLEAAVPAVLTGLLNRTSGRDGASVLGGMLGTPNAGTGLLDNLGSMFSGGSETENLTRTGSRMLGSIFGSGLGSVTNTISSFAGMQRSSASSMLALSVPLVLSFLNRYKASRGLTDSGLLDQLRDQKSQITGMLPRSLSGLVTAERPADAIRDTYEREVAVPRAPAWRRWLPLLIAAAIAIPLLLWLAGRTRTAAESLTLPGGVRIAATRGSLAHELATYLASGNAEPGRTFVFDNLTFETGTARLTPESTRTVDSVSTILNAYPSVKIRLQGHTDNTGDAAANQSLSLARANEVRNRLAGSGVAGERMESAGFGSDRPIASNETPDGRARNRRTELVVTQR